MEARLQKILSAAGVASRRTAETLIEQGRVTVNGVTVRELGTKADPAADDIRVDGRRVKGAPRRRYLLLYKPRGYITSRADPQHRPTVMDLLTRGGVREYVYPVGRLDYDSEGLLILTSDGDLAARLTHPRHGVEREYEVRVRGVPGEHELERLSKGISLAGRRTAPSRVQLARIIEPESGPQALLSFVIHEGRNRQVREMCDAIGHPVVRLRRVRIGPITDPHIRPGEFRDLTAREVAQLNAASFVGRVPRSGPAGQVPRSGPAGQVPRSGPAGQVPRSGPAARVSRSGPAGQAPRSGPAARVSRSGPAGQAPRSGPAGQAPRSGPAARVSRSGPAGQAPRSGPGARVPRSGPARQDAAERPRRPRHR